MKILNKLVGIGVVIILVMIAIGSIISGDTDYVTRSEFNLLVQRVDNLEIRVIELEGGCIPEVEICDGIDNDCDGIVDEGCNPSGDKFYVWLIGDTHINNINNYFIGKPTTYQTLVDAIEDSEQDWSFDWDIALILGDITQDGLTQEFIDTKNILHNIPSTHNREDFYLIAGNHDWRGDVEDFKIYIDPIGNSIQTSGVDNLNRKYALHNTTNSESSYTLTVGNTVFICQGNLWNDIDSNAYNYNWWENIVENTNNSNNILCFTHHPVRESGITVGSKNNYWDSQILINYLSSHNGRVDAWFCGHRHYRESADDTYHSEKWGTTFINVAGLRRLKYDTTASKSMVMEFTVGSDIVIVHDYFHGFRGLNYPLEYECWDTTSNIRGEIVFTLNNPFSW